MSSLLVRVAVLVMVFCSTLLPIQAIITTTNRMDAILPEVTSQTLVIFDIDNTLITQNTMAISTQGLDYFAKKKGELIQAGYTKEKLDWLISFVILNASPVVPVEPYAPDLVRSLPNRGAMTMVLTARGTNPIGMIEDMGQLAISQLDAQNYTFNFMADQPQTIIIEGFAPNRYGPPQFRCGYGFTGKRLKGEVLVAFFDQIGFTPQKVIFVDDNYDQISSVDSALTARNIPVVCFHYTAGQKIDFDEKVIDWQVSHLIQYGKWIPDNEARQQVYCSGS